MATVSEWLRSRTAEWQAFADAINRVAEAPTITVSVAGDDRTEADAIKRGQRPEQIAALRKALGL